MSHGEKNFGGENETSVHRSENYSSYGSHKFSDHGTEVLQFGGLRTSVVHQ